MKTLKILNLYACLGGNRFKWDEVVALSNHKLEVIAVELDPYLAELYQERFPNDKVIVADAHSYLLDNYKGFDFIWSSPPCPSHSRMRKTNTGQGERKGKATYPDLGLYQEIIFLQHIHKGGYCVENVIPYYQPLMPGKKRGRHIFWTNFHLPSNLSNRSKQNFIKDSSLKEISKFHNYDFNRLKDNNRFATTSHEGKIRIDKIARNLVDYEAGATILASWLGVKISKDVKQVELF